jgi:hypothetical protein
LFCDDLSGIENVEHQLETAPGAEVGSGPTVSPWRWPLKVSSPERAILEALDELPAQASFDNLDMIFQGLANLRPKRLMSLLRSCRSIKVRRLFFVFADRHAHAWVKHLDKGAIDLCACFRRLRRKKVFALKGGSAVNLLCRNMPRLSVDVDQVYLPVEERETSLRNIDGALDRITKQLARRHPKKKSIKNNVIGCQLDDAPGHHPFCTRDIVATAPLLAGRPSAACLFCGELGCVFISGPAPRNAIWADSIRKPAARRFRRYNPQSSTGLPPRLWKWKAWRKRNQQQEHHHPVGNAGWRRSCSLTRWGIARLCTPMKNQRSGC